MENHARTFIGMRLHLGAGPFYWPGFVNIDHVGDQDRVGDISDLREFEDNSVDEIHVIHSLEHIHRMKVEPTLAEWRRVLKVGGKLVLEIPSLKKIAQMIIDGEKNLRLTLLGLYGDPREANPYMEHKWCWSEDELGETLRLAGFADIEFLEPAFHIPKRDMRVVAFKQKATRLLQEA